VWCRETFVMLRQTPRTFVERLDFLTSVGQPPDARAAAGRRGGAGVTCVVTDLGVLEPDPETRELTMTELYPDVTIDDAREATGWDLRTADDVRLVQAPTRDELQALRALEPANEQTVTS
jgi:glutaconate CoA-transferase, subunit B